MTHAEDMQKAKDARDKMGEIFEAQVKDDDHDNGLLDMISKAAQTLEDIVLKLKEKGE